MRGFLLVTGLLFVVGCGNSKSDKPVNLSIDNPKKAPQEPTGDKTAQLETPENARKLLVQAAKLAKQGHVGKAVELLSHAISLNTEDPELYIARAEVYAMMGENANALADYSIAIRVRPNDASIHNRRGFFLLSRNEHTRALKDFTESIRLSPDSPQAYNNRGLVYLSLSDPTKAIKDFSKATELDPRYADAWNNRGFAHYKTKKYKQALSDLSKALKAKPGYVNAYNNRGLVHMAMKNYPAAIDDMTAAIESTPYEIKLFRTRRAAYIELQQFDDARRDASRIEWLVTLANLTQSIDREPMNYLNYMRRGKYLAEGNEHEAAIRDFSRAARLNNSSADPLTERAASLIVLDQIGDAIRDCDTAIELGTSQRKASAGSETVAAQEQAMSASGDAWMTIKRAFSVRGDAWMAKQNYSKAIADFEKAERFDTVVADAYLLRAQQYEQAGKARQALADRQRAAAIDPSRRL